LARLWQAYGIDETLELPWLNLNHHKEKKSILITGGAGFMGSNLADRLLTQGQSVTIYDNLSGDRVERNLDWLYQKHRDSLRVVIDDVRNVNALSSCLEDATHVFHFAAQPCVTRSLEEPIYDFEVNARGTLNLLEALRASDNEIPLLFTSSAKVYGDLEDLDLRACSSRYETRDPNLALLGFSELQPLAFTSPYACSKGVACQYILDYANKYGLPAIVFRVSSVYGPHQHGSEHQGWISHFLKCALEETEINIFGDGRQLRDVLFIDDFVDACLFAMDHLEEISGQVFNMGGGPDYTLSPLELLNWIEKYSGKRPKTVFQPWRLSDTQYFVSDIRKFENATGWRPQVSPLQGLEKLNQWLVGTKVTHAPLFAESKYFQNETLYQVNPSESNHIPESQSAW
jgi:CDP-paratose 2-epimerase